MKDMPTRIAPAFATRLSFRLSEVKDVIGVDPSTIYRWIRENRRKARKIDGTTLILVKVWMAFLRAEAKPLGGQLGA